jgi:rubredoxin
MYEEKKYSCPCCGYYTLASKPPGTFDICPVCYWEDDNIQFMNPEYEGGANEMSLNQARKNYRKFGAISENFLEFVREPLENEKHQ